MKKLNLNIQLFAEEADNVDDIDVNVDDTSNDSDAAIEKEEISQTKAFSDRLNKKTKEIEDSYNAKLNNLAKIQGYDSWDDFEEASHKQNLKDIGIDEDNMDKFERLVNSTIDKNPDVVKAKEIVKKAEEEKRQKELIVEVNKIHDLDDSIESLDDVAKLDNVQDIIGLVNKGYTLFDAYRLVNYDKIMSNNSTNAKKRAVDDIKSKSHMKTSQGGNGKTVYVPEDIYNMYKRNMPKWTDSQIREHYGKSLKED